MVKSETSLSNYFIIRIGSPAPPPITPTRPPIYPPITISEENVVANPGDTVTLTCRSSSPRMTLIWSKDRGRLPITSQSSGGILTLYQVTSQDSGTANIRHVYLYSDIFEESGFLLFFFFSFQLKNECAIRSNS